MSLDLNQTAAQIEGMAVYLKARMGDRQRHLDTALETLSNADVQALEMKRQQSNVTWLVPGLAGRMDSRYPAPTIPEDFFVLSVDGSHIDVDRHMAARCYLINLGACVLTYGSKPQASLFSRPVLFATEEELVITDPEGRTRAQPVEGAILGMKRAVEEMKGLARLIEDVSPEIPTLALIDGSLIMWSLAGQGYPDYVRDAILHQGFLTAMDEVRAVAESRISGLALASYISLPRSTEVINALRLKVCPYDPADCDRYCRLLNAGQRPCDSVGDVLDRDLFAKILAPGERSALFASTSSIVREYYGPHQVFFYYVNVGWEIGRVELPAWVAQDEVLLGLSHSLIVDQCRRGQGYPVAIQEAHEQAVVSGADRALFQEMVDKAFFLERMDAYTSEKSRSKRARWL